MHRRELLRAGLLSGAGLVLSPGLARAEDETYTKALKKTLQNAFKEELTGYTFRSTPIGTFGVGTMYRIEVAGEVPKTPDADFLIGYPETWFDERVPLPERRELTNRIIVRGSLGSVNFTKDLSKKASLSLGLPVVGVLLNAAGQLDLAKGTHVSVTANNIVNRRINWLEFESALMRGKIKRAYLPYLQQRNFVLATADLALDGYTVEVKVSQQVNPQLHSQLSDAVTQVAGQTGSIGMSVSVAQSGSFVIKNTDPVVAAVKYAVPPAPSRPGAPLPETVPPPDSPLYTPPAPDEPSGALVFRGALIRRYVEDWKPVTVHESTLTTTDRRSRLR